MSFLSNCIFVFSLLFALSSSQLTFYLPSSSVSEGKCISPSPPIANNINVRWLGTPRLYYFTWGSKSVFRRYAEVLLGRPAKSVDELENMCLQVNYSGKNVTTFGSGKTIEQSCPSTKTGLYNCFAQNGSPGTNITTIDNVVETVVYTDNRSAILVVRCVNNEFKDYKLLTVGKTVDTNVLKEAKAKLTQLKFSSLYNSKLSCDGQYAIIP